MKKFVVMNTKGGCGKTTIATNLASRFASAGHQTALFDYDPQGSSSYWLKLRGEMENPIHGVQTGYKLNGAVTRSFLLRVPPGTERIVVDTPASINRQQLTELTRDADAVIVPILPSSIDSHVAADFIRELLLVGRVRAKGVRMGIIANRARTFTSSYKSLERFLSTLSIPVIATLHDSQSYVHAAERGLGIHELKDSFKPKDVETWEQIMDWLESKPTTPATLRPHVMPGMTSLPQ